MTSILQNQTGAGYTQPNIAQIAIDAENRTQSQFYTASQQANSSTMGRKSLNRDARKRELMKITMENQKILQRLQERGATYNVTNWAKENEKRKKLLNNICEYPY